MSKQKFVFEKMIDAMNVRLIDLIQRVDPQIQDKEEPLALFALLLYRMNLGNALIKLTEADVERYFDEFLMKMPDKLQQKNDDDKDVVAWKKNRDDWKELCLKSIRSKSYAEYPSLMGEDRLFVIKDGNLYAQKFFAARNEIIARMDVLFNKEYSFDGDIEELLPKYINEEKTIELKGKQREIAKKGVTRNLLITGGPGTGKTSVVDSIICTLQESLVKKGLSKNKVKDCYIAPSAKAAKNLHPKGTTIHVLLSYNPQEGGFKYCKKNQLPTGVFVIDEASMIDMSLFASLLNAIPDDARVFILGDKDQLPPVGLGAAFSDLLKRYGCETLEETHRFGTLAQKVAADINDKKGANLDDKTLLPDYNETNPQEVSILEKPDVDKFVEQWVEKYYKPSSGLVNELKEKLSKLDIENELVPAELNQLCSDVWCNVVEFAKILCCENEGPCGVSTFNQKVIEQLKHKKIHFFDIKMVTRNTKELNLSNGDTGISIGKYVLFRNTKKVKDGEKIVEESKLRILPLGRIDAGNITDSFAMTVHKSQGSGYNHVALVLPEKENHPLLNRQILYTAITRTKKISDKVLGSCVILSDVKKLKAGAERLEERETGIN